MQIITTTNQLQSFCAKLKEQEASPAGYITIDTEFIRETTYWPILCLIQVAGSQETAIIDPLAEGIDLFPFYEILQDDSLLKVFHAARQDLEIFFKLMGTLPKPIFDTQVAAMVCGYGDSIAYESLVNDLANAKIDKSARFTNWGIRPLTERQLTYALADVTHLRTIYEQLRVKLETQERTSWIHDEMDVLTDPKTYQENLLDTWKRIKMVKTAPEYLVKLQQMAAFREQEAQKLNKARGRLVKDEVLVNLAIYTPKDFSEVRNIATKVQKGISDDIVKKLYQILEETKKIPESLWPRLPKKPSEYNASTPNKIEFLKLLLKIMAKNHHVSEKLIATTSDLEKIALYAENAQTKALQGWRYELFGKAALGLIKGNQAIALKGNHFEVIALS